jgi:hypothetical protein
MATRYHFPRSFNVLARLSIYGGALIIVFLSWVGGMLWRSSYVTSEGAPVAQPVEFSHEHHVGGLGMDCRYCHGTVERAAYAGMPPTETCMNCHSQLWTTSPQLAPVRASYLSGQPIPWQRVNNLADFVYFKHNIHVNKGIGCASCHGQVDRMPLTWQAAPLTMEWCLECHRNPARYVRPREQVFNMDYQPPPNQLELGRRLVEQYHIERKTRCSNCHY